MKTKITHVIFDLDNTLVKTIDFLDMLKDYAKSLGKELSQEFIEFIPKQKSESEMFDKYFDSLDLSEDTDRSGLIEELIRRYKNQDFPLIAGVDRLVQHLYRHDIPMAIATGNHSIHYELVNTKRDNYLRNYFSHSVCGWDNSQVVNKKPNPDIYFVCAERFQTQPKSVRNVLIIEDSLCGITGAVASGMQTLLINDLKDTKFDIIIDKTTCISDSITTFKPESLGFPPYE